MKKINGILLSTTTNSCLAVYIYKSPNEYCRQLLTTDIGIMNVKVDGKTYALVYDSEAYNKAYRQTSVETTNYEVVAVGNVLVFGIDTDKEELTDLNKEDMKIILDKVKTRTFGEELQPILFIDGSDTSPSC